MILLKYYTQYTSTFGKLSDHRAGKVSFPIPEKGNAKEWSNYCTVVLISHASKVMFRILQARLEQYVNRKLPMYKLDLEKAGTRD